MPNEREDTLRLCREVTAALCSNLNERDSDAVYQFFTKLIREVRYEENTGAEDGSSVHGDQGKVT